MNSQATAEEAFFQTTFIQCDDVFSKPAPVIGITKWHSVHDHKLNAGHKLNSTQFSKFSQ